MQVCIQIYTSNLSAEASEPSGKTLLAYIHIPWAEFPIRGCTS